MERITRLQTFARLGFLARAVVYILLGYFALTTAGSTGPTGILAAIKDAPLGTVLLALVGIGLLGYGIYRLYGAMIGLDAHGSGVRRAAERIGHAASGAAHLFLGYVALRGAFGAGGGPAERGESTGQAAGAVASWPGGEILLYLIGLGFIGAAASQAKKAYSARFMMELDPDVPAAAEPIGRIGYGARAVVFLLIGWQILSHMLAGEPRAVGSIEEALTTLSDTAWLSTLVAIGLLLFGVYSLVMARYLTIRDEDVIARLKAQLH